MEKTLCNVKAFYKRFKVVYFLVRINVIMKKKFFEYYSEILVFFRK